MLKAYGKIEWDFVKIKLTSMGFSTSLISVIMASVTTISYEILINSQPSRRLLLGRGQRKEDPLSPYLFILCANVLFGPLSQKVKHHTIHGIKVERGAPTIAHLFFADENILFARSNEQEAEVILKTLLVYQKGSIQLVNLDKSKVFFSRNVNVDCRVFLCSKMGVQQVETHPKYLGLPGGVW